VGTDPLEDPGVLGVDRLGPHLRDPELDEAEHGEHAGLDVGADAHDGAVELLRADLTKCLGVGRVGSHHVGEVAGEALHDLGALVDGQDVVSELDERAGHGRTKATEADHDHRCVVPA
jgi:hypothetical protein